MKTPSNRYPKFSGTRTLVAGVLPETRTRIAGRMVGGMLQDESGAILIEGAEAPDSALVALWGALDPVSCAYFIADEVEILAAATGAHGDDLPTNAVFQARAELLAGIRGFFAVEDFIEVETPNLVAAPGTDVHLTPFETRFGGMGEHTGRTLWLHTSPEFTMKRLLVAGLERIFQICKVWRDEEWTARHHPEFTLVEWYRAYADWEAVMRDVEQIVATSLGLEQSFVRLRVEDALQRYAGVDLSRLRLRAEWEDEFHEILVTEVEPCLEGAVFLTHYPRELAVLSRVCDDDPRFAERFELYVDGVELCNGFTELTDSVEQRQRFEEDQKARARRGSRPLPLPELFLDSLRAGMPPSGGVALGLDRLLMLQLGKDDLDGVLIR